LGKEMNAMITIRKAGGQLWLLPAKQGIQPSYEQKSFAVDETRGRLRLVASPDGHDGSLTVHADASLYTGLFDKDETATLPLAQTRHAWVHVARGQARINGHELQAGDGAMLSNEPLVQIEGVDASEVLVFDLA
jgi:quercetin 2,3-dioxygenase